MNIRTATATPGHLEKTATKEKAETVSLENNSAHARTIKSPLKSRLNILIALGMVAFFYFASSVVLPVIIALVLSMVLKPFVLWLGKWHLPRPVATLLILCTFFAIACFGFTELSQPAMKWINNAPENIAKLRQRFEQAYPAEKVQKAVEAVNVMGATGETGEKKPQAVAVKDPHGASAALTWTGGLLGGLLETLVLLYMFLVMGDQYLEQILDGSESTQERKSLLKISREVQETISKYLFTVSYINLALGILVATGLFFMGVPNAPLWGLLAMLLNYIPYFGPIIGIIVVGLVGLLGGPVSGGVMPAAWYLLLHIAEADFITPALLGRQFTVNPIVIFVSLLFWTWLWGPLGALLAMPILMSLKVICRGVPKLAGVTRFL